MGDSSPSQVRQDMLSKKGTIKVRCFPGANLMTYHYAIPLINEKSEKFYIWGQTTLHTVRPRKWLTVRPRKWLTIYIGTKKLYLAETSNLSDCYFYSNAEDR